MPRLYRFLSLFAILLLAGCGAPADAPVAAMPSADAAPAVTAAPEPDPAAMGETLLAAGDYAGAIDAFARAAEQDPADAARVRALLDAYGQAETAGAGTYTGERITVYETLAAMDAATDADTLALAGLYRQTGRTWAACRLLETAQLLSPGADKQAILDELVIDAASVDGGAQAALTQLEAQLAAGDTDAAAAMLLDEEAYASLASSIPDTARRYRLDAADGGVLRAELVRLLPGQERFAVWYLAPDGRAAYLCRDAGALSVVTAQWRDGAYSGAFSALYLDANTGSVFADTGTLTNDIWTGAFTATAAFGTEATPLAALWQAREATPPVTYTGEFDAAGHATAKQQKDADGVVYAYTEDQKAYLYLTVDADAASYVFGIADLALAPMPVY